MARKATVDQNADIAMPYPSRNNCRERVPGATPVKPWPRIHSWVDLPLEPVRVPGDDCGS